MNVYKMQKKQWKDLYKHFKRIFNEIYFIMIHKKLLLVKSDNFTPHQLE